LLGIHQNKYYMKKKLTMLALIGLASFSSCNNATEEKKPADSTTAITPAKPVFTPFDVSTVTIKVKNFAVWKTAYMAGDSARKAYGLTHYVYARSMDDSNVVMIINKVDDIKKANEFRSTPNLKAAMQKAGVIGAPTVAYAHVIRNDDTKIDEKDRVMVSHKVKDFAAWLKIYDADSQNRIAGGLIDRGMARDVADSNLVHLVFAIKDMTKAKAMMNSPELKKTMEQGGVQGPPTFFFYKLVE
jgi:hypothetical protein